MACELILQQTLAWKLIDKALFQKMDETTSQVLHEPGRPPTAKSYVWVNLAHVEVEGQEELKSIILYHYHPSRASVVVSSTLAGHEGYLQTDGYEAYDTALSAGQAIIHLGCLAHVRRKFYEAAKIAKKPGLAQAALAFIAKVYRIETECREQLSAGKITREQFVERRDGQARPILEQFMSRLGERVEQVPPTSKLGEAIGYARRQLPRIVRYLDA